VLVVPSRAEGGANVVSEAAVRDIPVLATRIPGNTGLLGRRHPGLFAAGDAPALARLLARCAREPRFLDALRHSMRALARACAPSEETKAWRRLLAELRGPRAPGARAGRR